MTDEEKYSIHRLSSFKVLLFFVFILEWHLRDPSLVDWLRAFTFRLFRIHNVNHYNNQHVGNHGDKSQRTIVASAFLRTLAIV